MAPTPARVAQCLPPKLAAAARRNSPRLFAELSAVLCGLRAGLLVERVAFSPDALGELVATLDEPSAPPLVFLEYRGTAFVLHRRLLERRLSDALDDAPAEGERAAAAPPPLLLDVRASARSPAPDADGALLGGLLRAIGGVRRALAEAGDARRGVVVARSDAVEEADTAVGAVALAGWLLEYPAIYCMPPGESAAHCLDAEPLLRVDLELGVAGGGERATIASFTLPAARARDPTWLRALGAWRERARARLREQAVFGDLEIREESTPAQHGVAL